MSDDAKKDPQLQKVFEAAREGQPDALKRRLVWSLVLERRAPLAGRSEPLGLAPFWIKR